MTMPTWTSPGRATSRPDDVGAQEQDRAEQRRVRHHPAVVGAHQPAGDVGDDQADEARSARPPPPRRRPAARTTPRVRARVRATRWPSAWATSSPSASALSARPASSAPQQADGHERPGHGQHVEVAAGHRADDPEAELVQRLRVDHDHGRGQRREQGRHGRAGQGQVDRRRAGAGPGRAEHVHGDARDHGAQRRRTTRSPAPSDAQHEDGGDHDERRPRRDAQDARVGQRVARHALDHRARGAEARAHRQRHQRARAAHVAHDHLGVGVVEAGEGADDVVAAGSTASPGPARPARPARRRPAARPGPRSV